MFPCGCPLRDFVATPKKSAKLSERHTTSHLTRSRKQWYVLVFFRLSSSLTRTRYQRKEYSVPSLVADNIAAYGGLDVVSKDGEEDIKSAAASLLAAALDTASDLYAC